VLFLLTEVSRIFRFLHSEAPLQVFTFHLVAVGARLAKAGEVSLVDLFSVDNGGDDFSEAGIAKRGADILRTPRDFGVLFPFLTAFDTFDAQPVHLSALPFQ